MSINVTETTEEIPQILSDHIFVELELLSGKISQEEIEQYERDIEEYHELLTESKDMGFKPKDLKKPIEPKYQTDYKMTNVNLTDKVFTFWSVEWDSKHDHPIIVAEYYVRESGVQDQLNIKATKKEWMDLLQQFGAIHTKLIKNVTTNINSKPE